MGTIKSRAKYNKLNQPTTRISMKTEFKATKENLLSLVESANNISEDGEFIEAGEAVVVRLSDDVKRALIDARNLAMTNTVKARAPECGDFGVIAQGLDFICDQLGLNAQHTNL